MTNEPLKPCQFCGGEAEIDYVYGGECGAELIHIELACQTCKAGFWHRSESWIENGINRKTRIIDQQILSMTKKWNTRP